MPELPEVETVRRDLARDFVGKRIEQVTASGVHRLRRHSPAPELVARVTGRRLIAVRRRGKYLVGDLDGGDALVMHLGMSGQLRRTAADEPLAPHSHVVLHWEGDTELRFVDPRTFGELFVTATDPATGAVAELSHLGLDAFDNRLTWPQAARLFAGRRTRLKPLLMDQRFLAGIGNLYADEILWASRLRADRPACALSGDEVRRLWRTRRATLPPGHRSPGLHFGGQPVPGPGRLGRRLPGLPSGLRPGRPAVPAVPHPDRPGHGGRPKRFLLPEMPGLSAAEGRPGAHPGRLS